MNPIDFNESRMGTAPTAPQLHYRSNFDLISKLPEKAWPEIIKTIRSWLKFSLQSEADLIGPWFFLGGSSARLPSQRHKIITSREDGDGSNDRPQFWAVRYEHPCKEWTFRQWRTDIGITSISDRFRISIATSYWTSPYFIGQEPNAPIPTAPAVVASFLRNRNWTCQSGSEPLLSVPRILHVGDGIRLRERLEALDRQCPIVLITCSNNSQAPMLDARGLARTLTGAGVVYVAASADIEAE